MQQYGPAGAHYENSRVTYIIKKVLPEAAAGTQDLKNCNADEIQEAVLELLAVDNLLLQLLQAIHKDWYRDKGDDGVKWNGMFH